MHWILDHRPAVDGHHTAVMVRTLDRYQNGLQDPGASQYLDIIQGKTPSLDADRWGRMDALRKTAAETVRRIY